MAITTTTISRASGYGRTDVIQQMEEGFAWLQWHDGTTSGIVTGITTFSGGGTVGTANTNYYDVRPSATSGIGTGASFYVNRNDGPVLGVYVNRPGKGYALGDTVTLPAAQLGGTGNSASNMTVTVAIHTSGGNPVGYGSTQAFYDKDISDSSTAPWGVAKLGIDTSKAYGTTYWGFQMISATAMTLISGSDFHPYDATGSSTHNDQMGYGNRFAGNKLLDLGYEPVLSSEYYDADSTTQQDNYVTSNYAGLTVASSNSYQLDLNIFRSSIDSDFAVFNYVHPDKSANYITDKTYATFIIHNFTSTVWDLDNVFLGGFTEILPGATSEPELTFRTHPCQKYTNDYYPARRSAEFGYYPVNSSDRMYPSYKDAIFAALPPNEEGAAPDIGLYYRNNSKASTSVMNRGRGGYLDNSEYPDAVADDGNYNAVIKGIPLNATFVPSAYYIPDDFVLIQFDYSSPDALIQPWDTVTVSGSEVYTVITGSYNQSNRTRGILFCARTT